MVVDGLVLGQLLFVVFVGLLLFHEVAVVVGRGEVLDYAALEVGGETAAEVVEPVEHQFDLLLAVSCMV